MLSWPLASSETRSKDTLKLSVSLLSSCYREVLTSILEHSPNDYLLYYKRATSNLSLQRHTAALEDFDKVLSLSSSSFSNAHLQKARIFTKEGDFASARHSLSQYLKAKNGVRDAEAEELEKDITEGDEMREKTKKERGAQLWTSCVETASQALRVASHSTEIRNWRAECALAAGDAESAVGDLRYVVLYVPRFFHSDIRNEAD